ncbi:phospholipase B1, membrane-associated-like isoform X2 [Clavelina lepadiformis]|uniref:phospholipase B1, membrane-associated-like isoform X2 n=1 Tax=Clavelina lepadiformis TaxID=159417 RepID=UPI00404326F4
MLLPFVCLYLFFAAFAHGKILESEAQWLEKLQQLQKVSKSHAKPFSFQKSTGISDFDVTLTCPKPTSVHKLRPSDIDVVGAMGDSITAGFGIEATTAAGIAIENRGLSWTIGGEESLETSLTIPNILRKFKPDVKGYSIGRNIDPANQTDFWFNVAVGGARSRDMPEQARNLIQKMKNDSRISFEEDWKLISIFIGGNDLCALNRDESSSPENYVKTLKESLDILHDQVPRALVNLIEILEIYLLPQVPDGFGASPSCKVLQTTFCNYVVTANETETEHIRKQNKLYQSLAQDLIDSGVYDTKDDFSVVIQPFFRDSVLPYTEDGQVDATFFAPDCFHFSSKGHAMGALNLWNNMLEPVGQKTTKWGIKNLKCPTEEAPYIYTSKNSRGEAGINRPCLIKLFVFCFISICLQL